MTKQGGWPSTGFGAALRQHREQAGLSQKELAEKAGCNQFTVAKLERGEQEPAWPLVLALAKALGVECTAFSATDQQPEAEKRGPGRPKNPAPEGEPAPARPRGRPKKDQGAAPPAQAGPAPAKRGKARE